LPSRRESLTITEMHITKEKLGILVIAAGNSSRLGQPKQLVHYKDQGLLEKTLKLAEKLSDDIVCVLGYEAQVIKNSLKNNEGLAKCNFVVNDYWQQGMGSSISCGVKILNHLDDIMIMLCDQYLIDSQDLDLLITEWKKQPNRLIASQFIELKTNNLITGAPAIFPSQFFSQLETLREKGARHILQNKKNAVIPVTMHNAATDLDTKHDLTILRDGENYD
jgi:molybdenum cofactor cytidylyltransferase